MMLVVFAAGVASYLARTDAFAIIAWIVIAFLAAGVMGVIYGIDETVRYMKVRRRAQRDRQGGRRWASRS